MNFFPFIFRTFALTPFVVLRMIPLTMIYALIAYAAYKIAAVLILLLLIPIFAIGIFLVMMLIMTFYEVAILRSALASLKRLTGASPENLMAATFRHFFLYRLLLGLFAACIVAIPLSIYFGLQEIGFLEGLFGLTNATDAEVNAAFAVGLFFVIGIPWLIVITVLDTLFAVPMAANAASASARSPRYDPLFGLGRQFWKVLVTTIVASILPSAMLYVMTPLEPLSQATTPEDFQGALTLPLIAYLVVSLLCYFVPFAAKSLAFTITVDENARYKEEAQDLAAVFGSAEEDQENLKSLRQARSGAASSVNVYDPKVNEDTYMSGRREAASNQSLKALRQSRGGQSGVSVYDPNESRRKASEPPEDTDL